VQKHTNINKVDNDIRRMINCGGGAEAVVVVMAVAV
jgi:hypothetical protein